MRVMKEIPVDSDWQMALIREGETFQCEARGSTKSAAFKATAQRDAKGVYFVCGIRRVRASQLSKLYQITQKF